VWSNYFDLEAILQERDNLQATSNETMYKTKYSKNLQLTNGRQVSASGKK